MKFLKCMGILIFLLLLSCQKNNWPLDEMPEILTAESGMWTMNEFEKGYKVYIKMQNVPEEAEIKAIVINKRKYERFQLPIYDGNTVEIITALTTESKMIQNFEPPKPDNRPDGIVFEIEGKEYFYEIKFELI